MKLFCVLLSCTLALTTVACGGNDESDSGGDGDGAPEGDVETGCVKVCEAANSCPGGDEQECDGRCALITAAAEFAGCTVEWEVLVDCEIANEDAACDETSDACGAELEAFESCTNDFAGGI